MKDKNPNPQVYIKLDGNEDNHAERKNFLQERTAG